MLSGLCAEKKNLNYDDVCVAQKHNRTINKNTTKVKKALLSLNLLRSPHKLTFSFSFLYALTKRMQKGSRYYSVLFMTWALL